MTGIWPTLLLGLVGGVGVILVFSPWMWPRRSGSGRRRARGGGIRVRLVQAGLAGIPVAVFMIVSALIGVIAASVVLALTPVVALAVTAGLVGAVMPYLVVTGRARRRRRALRAAWPDLVDHIVAGVRAGQSLGSAVADLAAVGPPEFRPAFREFDRVLQATGALSVAFDYLKQRLADPVADRIIETLRMSRDVGGTELPTVLRNLAGYLRHEGAVRAEVEARQSWVLSAARLGVTAPWIVLVLLGSRPEAAVAYNSAAGLTLLGVGLAVSVVAYRLMIALGRLPEERRWFA